MAKRQFDFDLRGGRDLTSLTAPNFDPVGPARGILEAEEDRLTAELGRSASLPQPTFPTPHPAAIGLAGLGDALVTLGQPRIGGRAHSAFSARLAQLNQRRSALQNRQQQQAFQQQEEVRQRAAQADLESTRSKIAFERDKEIAVIAAKTAAEAQGRVFEQQTKVQETGIGADVASQELAIQADADSQGRRFGHDFEKQGIDIAARTQAQVSDQDHTEAMQNLAFGQQVDLTQMNFDEQRQVQKKAFDQDIEVLERNFAEAREQAKTAVNSQAKLNLLGHQLTMARQEVEHRNTMKVQALDFLGRGRLQKQGIQATVQAVDLATRKSNQEFMKRAATEAGIIVPKGELALMAKGELTPEAESRIQSRIARKVAAEMEELSEAEKARAQANFTEASLALLDDAKGRLDPETNVRATGWEGLIKAAIDIDPNTDQDALKQELFDEAMQQAAPFTENLTSGHRIALRSQLEAEWRQSVTTALLQEPPGTPFSETLGSWLRALGEASPTSFGVGGAADAAAGFRKGFLREEAQPQEK